MPDGYSVDLDQFQGLDQIGEEGLKDKVNNHYLQIFGTSIALGVVAGASQITQGGGTTLQRVVPRHSPTAPQPVSRSLRPLSVHPMKRLAASADAVLVPSVPFYVPTG
jgi:type IV secretion system protein VirB10